MMNPVIFGQSQAEAPTFVLPFFDSDVGVISNHNS